MIFSNKYGLTAQINTDDSTAKIIYSPNIKNDVLIPRSVIYNSEEYIITSIDKNSFKKNFSIKSIAFSQDSKLQTIEKKAFVSSSVNKISFPSSLQTLKKGWCEETNDLNYIEISPKDKMYMYFDEKMIIGKSDENSQNYDILVFARRDIEEITIPSFIKHIDPYAFDGCYKLESLDFGEESELLSFGKCAFASTALKKITIPPKFNDFQKGWCQETYHLNEVEISPQNKLFSLYDDEIILGKIDPNSEIYDSLIFAPRDIIKIKIPSFIKRINSFAFDECEYLKSVKFEGNSQLISIGKCAFFSTRISKIFIPNHVNQIEKSAFDDCSNLKTVEFMEESELISIGKKAFAACSIENLLIPSKVKNLCELAFSFCNELETVEILGNCLNCDQLCFKGCKSLKIISFPNIKELKIAGNAFDETFDDFLLFACGSSKLDIF